MAALHLPPRDTVRGLLAGALVEVLAKAGGEGGERVVARVTREVAEVMAEQGGASKRARQEVGEEVGDLESMTRNMPSLKIDTEYSESLMMLHAEHCTHVLRPLTPDP